MTTLLVAMEDELLMVRGGEDGWQGEVQLQDTSPRCLAVDPNRPRKIYCGTLGQGLWLSNDAGRSWLPVADGIMQARVMAVAVSPAEQVNELGVAYAGTEPSAVFRSVDGGETWQERPGLTELPSSGTWAFPPRPQTHHVRWIGLDPTEAGQLFVCIEAGALVRSHDAGQTWADRVPGGPRDTHTLALHPLAPGRLYAAAGDGYFESRDGGNTWRRPRQGLQHHYLWGVAVDAADPDTILVSAASGAHTAHNAAAAESHIYRKIGTQPWQPIRRGLPDPQGTTITMLAAAPSEPGVFYAANNHGLYHSTDAGQTWQSLDVDWPQAYRSQRVQALAVAEIGS